MGSMDFRGKLRTADYTVHEFGSKKANDEGSVMLLVKKTPATIQKEDSIKHAADAMAKNQVRGLFVVDSTGHFQGIVTATDIVDFMGGGDKFKLIMEKHNGNISAAINEPVRQIMTSDAISITTKYSVEDAMVKLLETGVGYIPVLDDNKLVGSITERDLVAMVSATLKETKVEDIMSKDVIIGTSGMKLSDVAKVMVRNGFRRLPVVKEDELIGVVTTRDLITALSTNFSEEILDTVVEKLIKKESVTVSKDELVVNSADLMLNNNIGGLPVVEDGKVIGIITERDLIKSFSA